MTFKPRFYTTVGEAKKKRRTKEEVEEQNRRNNELAAEYKTASQKRRQEIFEEYYSGNKFWIGTWRNWDFTHWAELTQIFVSYWHEAFMAYTPFTEKSIFNFYMDRMYKSRASRDHRFFLERNNRCTNLEFTFQDNDEKPRRELFIHPQSEYDIADLRRKLVRSLDSQERSVVEGYFFGDNTLEEVIESVIEIPETAGKRSTSPLAAARYQFKKKYDGLLDKLYLRLNKEDLRAMCSNSRFEHPLNYMNERGRRVFEDRKHAKKVRELQDVA